MRGVTPNDELLDLIGDPTNDALREIHRLLTMYRFFPFELQMLRQEIMNTLPERTKRKRAA